MIDKIKRRFSYMPRTMFVLHALLQAGTVPFRVGADFAYRNFGDTTGVIFQGDAFTSSCANADKFAYGDVHSPNRENFGHVNVPSTFEETTNLVRKTEIETNAHGVTNDEFAFVGHRDDFTHEPLDECPVRIRLTPSEPEKLGSVWHTQSIEVFSGFECGFRFQITDLSRACNKVKDRNFGLKQYKACSVHGGDGFAFVVQGNTIGEENEGHSYGSGAEEMGYGGIANSIAVEFDTWYNPDLGDLFMDHISVHSAGPFEANHAGIATQLGVARPHPLADGQKHLAKVRYFPEIRYELLPYFTATQSTLKYIKDNEEGRRMGTLAVYVDGDDEHPILAMPINLSSILRLVDNAAFVGFTASTGSVWEKHDVLAWYCCENPPCAHSSTFSADHRREASQDDNSGHVDYHSQSQDHGIQDRIIPDRSTTADASFVP